METFDRKLLLEKAKNAVRESYSPYSLFRVGAALVCRDGAIITGTNIENRSYGLTICAERSAVFAAVSQGKRDYLAIAVYCADSTEPIPPCGACRQVLSEFCGEDFPVIFCGTEGKPVTKAIGELLPFDSLHGLKRKP